MVSSMPSSLGALCQDLVPLLAPWKGDWDKVGRVCDWRVSLTLAMNVAPSGSLPRPLQPKATQPHSSETSPCVCRGTESGKALICSGPSSSNIGL